MFAEALDKAKAAKGITSDVDLDVTDLMALVQRYKDIVRDRAGRDFPQHPREQLDLAMRFKQVYSTYQQNRDLVTVGAYRRGADPRVDLAVDQWPKIQDFLRQDMYEPIGIGRSYNELSQLVTQFSAQPPQGG